MALPPLSRTTVICVSETQPGAAKRLSMGLRELMQEHRDDILRRTRETIRKRSTPRVTARELEGELPKFYEQVIATLQSAEEEDLDVVLPPPSLVPSPHTELAEVAAQYGKELRRLGFSASQVVHVYGAICDALTRTA